MNKELYFNCGLYIDYKPLNKLPDDYRLNYGPGGGQYWDESWRGPAPFLYKMCSAVSNPKNRIRYIFAKIILKIVKLDWQYSTLVENLKNSK